MDTYAICGGGADKSRLDVIAATLRPSTVALLHAAGVGPGDQCLDVGCGGGHVAIELARLVGPTGSVVGVDLDEAILQLARRDAEAAGLQGIDFRAGDAGDIEPGAYDVAYTRLLLSHLPDPQAVIGQMARGLRPGGVLIIEDIDHQGMFWYPDSDAYERNHTLYDQLVRGRGGDPNIGAKLPGLLRRAGLEGVSVQIIQLAFMEGPAKMASCATLANTKHAAVEEGLISEDDVDRLLMEMAAFAQDPATLIAWPRVVQAWGRKAGGTPPHEHRAVRALEEVFG